MITVSGGRKEGEVVASGTLRYIEVKPEPKQEQPKIRHDKTKTLLNFKFVDGKIANISEEIKSIK